MQVRSSGVPDEPSDAHRSSRSGGDADRVIIPRHPDGSVRFAVPRRVLLAKFGAAIVVGLVALISTNRPQLVIGLIAAAGLTIYGLRDVVARERLRGDADGLVTVRGFASRHRLAWSDVERIRVDARGRLGTRTQFLEVDAGEHIYLYSRFDLGVDPDDAASALESVRAT